MSDGMSDSRAEAELDRDVWVAAFDLRDVAARLTKSVMRARMGHRGWGTPRASIVRMVNELLVQTGFELVDREPDKSFEHYGPTSYDRDRSWREKALERRHARLLEVVKVFAGLYQEKTARPNPATSADPLMLWTDDLRLSAAAEAARQDEEEAPRAR